ncbi:recombinase zinc beta ribbon domain-containing protein [Anaerotignum lactatifermentans]|uniref:recombinase zinc beta ribbon domain-containing protein n=1 Tax=Anaerotignum lactatifermentans TaxID=160404 RepID=UPI002674DA0C|nr:recombinase zinc beta ribbon domain-containing protein [Anaerotignum lactatifermentans]
MNRKVTVYGYQFIDGMLQIDEEQSQMVQEIFEVYHSGVPVSRLKDHIEGLEIHRVKLSDMLSDKRYLGNEVFPKIIDQELFEAVQQRKKERRKAIGKEQLYLYHKEQFLLGDKIKCGECGSAYHCYKHGELRRWDCSKRLVKGKVTCRNQHIQEDQVKELFMQAVGNLEKHPEQIRKITVYGSKRNIRIQAAEHEIKLLKNDSDHNIDELLKLIYKRASLLYETAGDGGAAYYTKKIEDLIQQHKEQPEEKTFDKDLFDAIIEAITIYKDGRVIFTLKNGAAMTETL